jgi:hypothetical protein
MLYREIATRTEDAYSADRYGRNEWAACAMLLLERGYTEAETEWVLRSKHMRWAADMSNEPDRPVAGDLARYLDDPRNLGVVRTIRADAASDA